MEKPLISIIIPAYNAGKYLGETIASVLAQTYSAWELIIVDGESTDDTAAIAERFALKDKRISYIRQKKLGIASGRNAGIAKARGKYLAFLDADNIFLPKKLELQIRYMESHPECGVCYSDIRHFYDGKPDILYKNKNEKPFSGKDIFRELLGRNFINVLAVLVRKELVDAHGAFPEGWSAFDEQYMWANLAYHGAQFAHTPDMVGLLRLHHTSDSARNDYLLRTATHSLQFLDLIESRFTEEEKKKYGADFARLKRRWKTRFFLGKLLINPFTSWFLMPLFLARRERNFIQISPREE